MVKVGFLKKYLKPLALLILIIILSMLLFSSVNTSTVNTYSFENFDRRTIISTVYIESVLWIDMSNSAELLNPKLTMFANVIDEYHEKGKTNFIFSMRDSSDIKNYFSNDNVEQVKSGNLASGKKPIITFRLIDKTNNNNIFRSAIGRLSDSEITFENIKNTLRMLENLLYKRMYNPDMNISSATSVASAASAASATSATSAASAAAAARAVNLSNFFNS